MTVRNLDFIRSLPEGITLQELGARLYEALSDVIQQQQNLAQQTNGDVTAPPSPPPGVQGVKVRAQNGHFQVAIEDQNEGLYRGVRYFVEHADNPQFTNPHIVDLGTSRNANLTLGNVKRYFRAYSAYAASPAGPPAYHGSEVEPLPVEGGGGDPGPAFLPSEGSGTGARGVGLSGPGPVPFRSATGAAPVR